MPLLLEYDKLLSEKVILKYSQGEDQERLGQENDFQIDFQFPPKVTSDNRGANWEEINMLAHEPVAVFMDSSAREITLEWTYIVTHDEAGADRWDTSRVHENVIKLRRYFGGIRPSGTIDKLIVMFKMWEIGGDEPLTFRFTNVGVRHGTTLVYPVVNGQRQYQLAYPLRTDITLGMRSWTRRGTGAQSVSVKDKAGAGLNVRLATDKQGNVVGVQEKTDTGEVPKINISQLNPFTPPDWF